MPFYTFCSAKFSTCIAVLLLKFLVLHGKGESKYRPVATNFQYIHNYFGPTGLDLSVSESCNLGCPMCFHGIALSNAEERRRLRAMPVEKAKRWIDYYISYAKEKNCPRIHSISEQQIRLGLRNIY